MSKLIHVLIAASALLALGLSTTGCGHKSRRAPAVVDDHGDDAASATALGAPAPPTPPPNPVEPWLQGNGKNDPAGDVDWFSVTLTAGLDYTFATTVDPGSDTVLRLIDRDGQTVLAENDDYLPGDPLSAITTQVPVDGVYYLEVRQKDPAATGGYRVFAKRGLFTAL